MGSIFLEIVNIFDPHDTSDPEDREQFSTTKLAVTTNKNGNVKIETKNKRKSVIV